MKVKTIIGKTKFGEWTIIVSSFDSVYTIDGSFFTSLRLQNSRGNGDVSLMSHYSKTEEEAGKMHLLFASKAKELFALMKI